MIRTGDSNRSVLARQVELLILEEIIALVGLLAVSVDSKVLLGPSQRGASIATVAKVLGVVKARRFALRATHRVVR
jgi:hypothetical protein